MTAPYVPAEARDNAPNTARKLPPTHEDVREWLQNFYGDLPGFIRSTWDVEPDRWQAEVAGWLSEGTRYIAVPSGHGALPADDTIPTPAGERRWGDLKPGDIVFGRNGHGTRVTAIYPQGVQQMYRVTFDDGTSLRTDAGHLWTVQGRRGRRQGSPAQGKWETISTKDIVSRGVLRANGTAKARQWALPPHEAVQYPAHPVPISAYILGAWLGDGDAQGRITKTGEARELLQAEWPEPVSARPDARSLGVCYRLPGLRGALSALGILRSSTREKRVPAEYMQNAEAVRLAVLQGLMDADGTAGKDNATASFCSTSEELVRDVEWLVRSLGGKAQRMPTGKHAWYPLPGGARKYCHVAYQCTVRLPGNTPLFRLARKQARMRPCQSRYLTRWIDSIEPDGNDDCMCISVEAPDHLYLAGDFVVTHNTGKTALVAWASIWFLLTRFPCKIVQTAPSQGTLQDGLFAETKMWVSRLPPLLRGLLEVTGERIVLKGSPASAFLSVRTARSENPDAIQGIHSSAVLLICDEASGIPDGVFQASGGSMSGPARQIILCGNPVYATGHFADAITSGRNAPWRVRNVSCLESKLAPPEFVEEIAQTYGAYSNVYRVRVLGLPPLGDDDTIVPLDLVLGACDRDVERTKTAPIIWGLDVARLGSNESALAKRQGNYLLETVKRYNGLDTMQLCGRIAAEYASLDARIKPAEICVDGIGLGAPVVDRLREMGLPATSIVVSAHQSHSEAYFNLKAELWWKCRAWFAAKDVKMPVDKELTRALTCVRIDHHSTGKLMVESKDSIARRMKQKAPRLDGADALVLTFASNATTALYGRKKIGRRKSPSRNLDGIV